MNVLKWTTKKVRQIGYSAWHKKKKLRPPTNRDKTIEISSIEHFKIPELGTGSFFRGSQSAQFLPMDRYVSIAHYADFQVRSSLNRSLKDQWFALGNER